jgi:hypothetical protein
MRNKKKISNIEQGMSNAEAIWQRGKTSSSEIPCSKFDIPSDAWQAYYSQTTNRKRIG